MAAERASALLDENKTEDSPPPNLAPPKVVDDDDDRSYRTSGPPYKDDPPRVKESLNVQFKRDILSVWTKPAGLQEASQSRRWKSILRWLRSGPLASNGIRLASYALKHQKKLPLSLSLRVCVRVCRGVTSNCMKQTDPGFQWCAQPQKLHLSAPPRTTASRSLSSSLGPRRADTIPLGEKGSTGKGAAVVCATSAENARCIGAIHTVSLQIILKSPFTCDSNAVRLPLRVPVVCSIDSPCVCPFLYNLSYWIIICPA